MKKLALALALSAASCVVPQNQKPVTRLAKFDPTEYEWSKAEGSATIAGQAFVKTVGGDVKFGAGNEIVCNPVTTYSTEWFERLVRAGENLELADPRAEEFRRKTIADGNGNFTFEKLPAGEYYIGCFIRWSVWNGYVMAPTGGNVGARVKVSDGESVRVILTDR